MDADQVNSQSSGRRDSLIVGCLIAVVAVAVVVTIFNSFRDNASTAMFESSSPAQAAEPVETIPRQVAQQLAALSPFNAPIGSLIGGIVPVVAVSDEEKSRLCELWQRVLAPGILPDDHSRIEWRKVLRSAVHWPQPDPSRKLPGFDNRDGFYARWSVGEMGLEIDSVWYPNAWSTGLTVRLPEVQRFHCEYPFGPSANSKYPDPVVVKDLGKPRLLQLLIEVLDAPWDSSDDFEVTWQPSPTSKGHLKVKATQSKDPRGYRAWYDEMTLDVRVGDPQEVRFGILLPPE